jgi:hypothetical protein
LAELTHLNFFRPFSFFYHQIHHEIKMAEVLGVVASGMSVVSLAIQVAESINKLKAFYSLVQSAPTDIILLLDELETLSLILEDVDSSIRDELLLNPRVKVAVMRSYRLCRSSGEALARLAAELELGINTGKKRGTLKAAMKKDKIDELEKRLESAKATMMLANQCYNQAIQQQNWESYERDMGNIMVAISGASQPVESNKLSSSQDEIPKNDGEERSYDGNLVFAQKSRSAYSSPHSNHGAQKLITMTATKKLFGYLDMLTQEYGNATATMVSLRLPSWIHARRYEFCLSKSYQGWEQSLRSYTVLSYDDLVFQYSMEGDVIGLQKLFQMGKASPFVADPDGRSPLHVSAYYLLACWQPTR